MGAYQFRLRVSGNSCLLYNQRLYLSKLGSSAIAKRKSTHSRKAKGVATEGVYRRVRKTLGTWLNTLSCSHNQLFSDDVLRNRMITFLTLTLSDSQKHEDEYIKRHMLGVFLQKMKRDKGIQNYFWICEPQSNGNLHFHVLLNKYVDWKYIRNEWNAIQDSKGYLTKYRKKHRHIDANSTDIHKLHKVDNVANYLLGYVTKKQGRRPCSGRIWGCSDSIRELYSFDIILNKKDLLTYSQLVNNKLSKTISKEFYDYVFNPVLGKLLSNNKSIASRYLDISEINKGLLSGVFLHAADIDGYMRDNHDTDFYFRESDLFQSREQTILNFENDPSESFEELKDNSPFPLDLQLSKKDDIALPF